MRQMKYPVGRQEGNVQMLKTDQDIPIAHPPRRYSRHMQITPAGGRVLGCLVEKQLTTPQQYPLTRNALSLACSQSTNRDPVVPMDERAVDVALESLRGHRLVRFVQPSSGRVVERCRHVLDEVYDLDVPSVALLAVLLLRGHQTAGEVRGRAARMVELADVAAAHTLLEGLAARDEPLVELLPRRPGQKEDRWRQLLAKEWDGGSSQPAMAGSDELPTDTGNTAFVTGVTGVVEAGEAGEAGGAPTVDGLSGDGPSDDLPTGAAPVVPPSDTPSDLQAQVTGLQVTVDRLELELAALRDSLGG